MATKRAPVRPVNKTPEAIRENAKHEAARKTASKKALRAARTKTADPTPAERPTQPAVPTPADLEAKHAAEAAAALKTMREDFVATATDLSDEAFAQFLKEQGYNEDGTVRTAGGTYTGPMLALRSAAKHYTKGLNGNPHCNDPVAQALDGLTREQVVDVLGSFLLANQVIATANPYLHLNPGQQSMNLRNKLRGALKGGLVTLEGLVAVVERASRHPA